MRIRRRDRYRNYLSISAVAIVGVILCFKFIYPPKIAALVASAIFLSLSGGVIYWEMRYPGFKARSSFWLAWVFLLFCILPILGIRLMNWDANFEELAVFGIPAPAIHKLSNQIFFILVASFLIESFRERKMQMTNDIGEKLAEIKTKGRQNDSP